jgi:hypothetical protein
LSGFDALLGILKLSTLGIFLRKPGLFQSFKTPSLGTNPGPESRLHLQLLSSLKVSSCQIVRLSRVVDNIHTDSQFIGSVNAAADRYSFEDLPLPFPKSLPQMQATNPDDLTMKTTSGVRIIIQLM